MANKILQKRRKVPNFPRQDAHKKIRVDGKTWRKARGRHGRVKRLSNYHGASPKIGYGTPAKTRNLHSSGLEVIEIATIKELMKIDTQKQGVKILSVGKKKKIDILKAALEKKIRVFNVRNPEEFIKKYEKAAKTEPKKEEVKEK